MGEYYNWVNVDRKEYLCPAEFHLGNKRYESLGKDNELLCALRELLFKEWKGCHIVFLGDECDAPDDIAQELFEVILEDAEKLGYPGDMLDTICESYRNVSCLFKAAEEVVREEVGYYLDEIRDGGTPPYNEYGIDINEPYKGLFIKEGKKCIYTLNHTKKCGYSLDITKILYQDGSICEYIDPLPILLGYGNRMNPGPWLGDIIGVGDELPVGYSLLNKIYLDW